ncbi:MAG: VWA domain-containing protein [Verrucomicrobiota bacterium]
MKGFVFQEVWVLALLGGIPFLWWVFGYARRKRESARSMIGGESQGKSSAAWRDWAWLGVYSLLAVALARPGYDPSRMSTSVAGRDVVFVLDVSRSMLAQDAYPSRLEAAKQGIRDCLEGFSGEQAALVIYAGSSSISCPLTADYEFLSYMLSQTQTRSVDFGGTLLLSAIEKVVDQVLDEKRRGYQDLVILTDGEDFGPEMSRVKELTQEKGASLLVVGLGNPEKGATIPVVLDSGEMGRLQHKGEVVYTRLEADSLKELVVADPNSEYYEAGTSPFFLGEVYRDFVADKEISDTGGDSVYIVYQEGAFWLMPFALGLALLAINGWPRWAGRASLGAFICLILDEGGLGAQEGRPPTFEVAVEMFESSDFKEASIVFGELHEEALEEGALSLEGLSALSFNEGFCLELRSLETKVESTALALDYALSARESFMRSLRENPAQREAIARLEGLFLLIGELERKLEEEEEERRKQQEQIQSLLERLQVLLDKQLSLRGEVAELDISRRSNPSKSQTMYDKTVAERKANAAELPKKQGELLGEGEGIYTDMKKLDTDLKELEVASGRAVSANIETVMATPMVLMSEALDAKMLARGELADSQGWPKARGFQTKAVEKIKEILDLFASDESEGDDYEGWDDDWDEDSSSDGGGGVPSSMAMEGDLRANSLMQPLPVPNFSVEDILLEEMGNQQFRQEKRAEANAGKVEKDW